MPAPQNVALFPINNGLAPGARVDDRSAPKAIRARISIDANEIVSLNLSQFTGNDNPELGVASQFQNAQMIYVNNFGNATRIVISSSGFAVPIVIAAGAIAMLPVILSEGEFIITFTSTGAIANLPVAILNIPQAAFHYVP